METQTSPKPTIEIIREKDTRGVDVMTATFTINGYDCAISPDHNGRYEFSVFKAGEPKVQELFFKKFDATIDDVEEIAEMYLHRLEAGADPADLDIDEPHHTPKELVDLFPPENRR